jgi:hypothetical protein
MAFLSKKLSIKSLVGKLKGKLGKIGGSLTKFAGKLAGAAKGLITKATSALSGALGVGGIKEGIKSLTSGISGQGVTQLTSGAAGNLLTSIIGGAGDIDKITGGSSSAGFNFAFSGGSGASAIASMMGAAQSTLKDLTASLIPTGLSAITGKIGDSLSKITGILPKNIIGAITESATDIVFGAQADIFKKFDAVTNVGLGQVMKDIVEDTTGRIGIPIDLITSNQGEKLAGKVKAEVMKAIDAGNVFDAAKTLNDKVKDSKALFTQLEVLKLPSIVGLTTAAKDALIAKWEKDHPFRQSFIEESLAEIETSVSSAIANEELTEAMGVSTTPVKSLTEGSEKWEGDAMLDLGIGTIDERFYKFEKVNSYPELESEIRSVSRDITEVIVNWTDTFKSNGQRALEGITVYDIFNEFANRGVNCHFHYLIFPNGDLVKMAPIGVETNHTSFGGWKSGKKTIEIANKDSHNKHSIGIAFVGGIDAFAPPTGRHETYRQTFNDRSRFGKEALRKNTGKQFFRKYPIDYRKSVNSYSTSQNKTFYEFMKTYYTIWPGGQAWGLNDLDIDQEGPGFSVSDYVFTQFEKVNTQTSEEKALSSKELKAKMIANKIKELTNG